MKIIKNYDIKSAKYGNSFIQELFSQQKHLISIAKVTRSQEEKMIEAPKDTYIYMLSGDSVFHIQSKKVAIKEGDVIFIPKKTLYIAQGDFDCLEIYINK